MAVWKAARRARRRPSVRSSSSADVRIFGQHKQQTTATDKLASAAKSVEAHVEQLSDKASLAKTRAAQLAAAGKKAEAMASLKKAKLLEKQLETATQTHAALETQVDVLAQSALQREVASALSASVATSKKRSKARCRAPKRSRRGGRAQGPRAGHGWPWAASRTTCGTRTS